MIRLKPPKIKIPVKTKWGTFLLEAASRGLYSVRFPNFHPPLIPGLRTRRPGIRRVKKRFLEYFKDPKNPLRIKLDLTGCTPFRKKVYQALMKVPAGKTITYAELARKAGFPNASRAVGSAMRKNRLPVVVPCHRVVPASGGAGNYSPGVKWKRLLLQLESAKQLQNSKS